MHVMEHDTLEELRRQAKAQPRQREYRRIQSVVLAREGKNAMEIAAALGCARRPVQDWVRRYNTGGSAALLEGKHTGRPPRLAKDKEPLLLARLEAGPRPEDGTCAFHGHDIRRILEKEFGVLLKVSAVYELLHRLDYSWLCPRPRHPDADPAAQEEFKKKQRERCRKSQRRIRTSRSKSGSRMRRDSVSRER